MKIKINGCYEDFEKTYDGFKISHQLSKLFEYTFQYKQELLKKLESEHDSMKTNIIKAKIKDIETIFADNKDLSTFLYDDATAL